MDKNITISAAAIAVAGLQPQRNEFDSDNEFHRELRRWKATVQAVALEVLEQSDAERGLVGSALANRAECAAFVAPELLGVELEESSQRYVITLRREKADDNGNWEEQMRTNRKDDWLHGPTATRLANQAKRLIGRRVFVHKRNEPMQNNKNKNVRICESIADAGPVKD